MVSLKLEEKRFLVHLSSFKVSKKIRILSYRKMAKLNIYLKFGTIYFKPTLLQINIGT